MIEGQRFLHDGVDYTGRYFAIAANDKNQIVVVDLKEGERVARIDTGIEPIRVGAPTGRTPSSGG